MYFAGVSAIAGVTHESLRYLCTSPCSIVRAKSMHCRTPLTSPSTPGSAGVGWERVWEKCMVIAFHTATGTFEAVFGHEYLCQASESMKGWLRGHLKLRTGKSVLLQVQAAGGTNQRGLCCERKV